MSKFIKQIALWCCILLLALPAAAENDAAKRKAEYLYLEALIKRTEDDNASFYELIKRAHELDPLNTTIAYYYGYSLLMMYGQTPDNINRGFELMKRHFAAHPEDFYENYILALVLRQLGKADEAIPIWESLIKTYPEKIQIYPELADCYAGQGEFQKAIAAYDSLERSEGKSSGITVRKIGYLFALNDTATAIKEGRGLLKDAPKNLSYNVLMGDIFLQLHNTDSAMVYYNKAQAIDPDNGYVNLSKANVYSQLGDSLRYEKEINTALVNKNIDVDTKVNILTSYIRQCIQENDSSARVDNMFHVIIEQHPHEVEILKLYCDYLVFKQDYQNAAEQLTYLLDINPTDTKDWQRLMWLYLTLKEPQKTIETGEKALAYNPDEIEVYQLMGVGYYQLKEYDKCLDTYRLLLEKNATLQIIDESDIYSGMAEALYQKGEQEKAFECYERAIEISPNNYMVLNNYAYFLCLSGKDLDKAERMSKISVEADPNNVSSLDTYAWICFLKQDYKTALEYIERAMSENGDSDPSAEMFEHYGDILFMNGRPEDALAEWEKALELDPESDLLKRKVEHKTYFYE